LAREYQQVTKRNSAITEEYHQLHRKVWHSQKAARVPEQCPTKREGPKPPMVLTTG